MPAVAEGEPGGARPAAGAPLGPAAIAQAQHPRSAGYAPPAQVAKSSSVEADQLERGWQSAYLLAPFPTWYYVQV